MSAHERGKALGAKRKEKNIRYPESNLLKTLHQTTTHIPILSSNLVTPYTQRNTGNAHRVHMGDIQEKAIKFGPIVDHLKDDPAAGEKKYFWDSKRSNLVGDFEINKNLREDIKSKQIKFGPHRVTT